MFTRKILSLILAVGVLSGLSANVFAHNNGLDFVDNLKEIIRTPGCAKSARHVFKEVKQYVKTPEVHAFCKEGKRITTLVIQNNKTKILTSDELDNCIQQFVEKFKLMCTKDPILQDAFNNAWEYTDTIDDSISVPNARKKGHASIPSSKNNLSNHKFNRNTRARRHATTSGC